jgi:hypothetical protein
MSSTSISSGLLTPATATLITGKATVNGVMVAPSATITIYDNTAASGNVILTFVNASTSTQDALFNRAVRCDIGLTYVISGGNAIIYFGAA